MSADKPAISEALYVEQERAVAGFRDQRKIEGLTINPETAVASSFYVKVLDPYEVRYLPLPDDGVARENFARAADGDVWVHFDDIPDEVTEKILEIVAFRKHLIADLREARFRRSDWPAANWTERGELRKGVYEQLNVWGFTEIEVSVGIAILKGLSVEEIARLCSLTVETVQQHASSIYKKSKTKRRAGFVAFFLDEIF